jgi:phosphomannomutase
MDIDAIFKAYDIRGVYPDQLDEEAAHRIGRAFSVFTEARRILLGRDMRSSSEPLSTAFITGAVTQGSDVVDIGLVSTDLLYFASGRLDLPGAMLTASHNPSQYNGIKLCREAAAPVGDDSGLREIKALVEANAWPQPRRLGVIEHRDMLEDYIEHLLSFVDRDALRPLVVVADAANGMAGRTLPPVFSRLPFKMIPLYFELDGTFPNHPADPLQPENLRALIAAVRENGAVLGMAFDGDADRVFLVDERGEPVSGSLTGALVARSVLAKNPGEKVLHSITCSRVVGETIKEMGGEPIRTRVGHSFMKKIMAETGAIFGCEHSGHYYFRGFWRADSGLLAALHVLEAVSAENRPLSEVLEPLRNRYWNSGEVNVRVADTRVAMERVAAAFEEDRRDWTDGLTVSDEDWWFNLRPSNTEPLIRLNVEARDPAEGQRHRDEILALLGG